MNTINSQNTKTSAAKILPFKEQTLRVVTETCKRITFGLYLVKVKNHAFQRYRDTKWDESKKMTTQDVHETVERREKGAIVLYGAIPFFWRSNEL